MAYLREKNKCFGCRAVNAWKPVTRERCKIKNCAVLRRGRKKFCYQCKEFPCDRLKHLDKRYRTRYHMSMIENLLTIKKSGIRKFVAGEKRRWTCSACGGPICVHRHGCINCGKMLNENR